MKAIDLYYRSFKETTIADIYRDKVEADIKARGYGCSADEVLNFVDYKSEQLVLLFRDDRRKELLASGILREAVFHLIIPKLDEGLKEFNAIGIYQTLYDISFILRAYVEVEFLKNSNSSYPEKESLGSVHAQEALKTLALMASWVPDEEITDRDRKLREELLLNAQAIASRIAVIFQNRKRNTQSLRNEYLDFKYRCIDLIFMLPKERFRV